MIGAVLGFAAVVAMVAWKLWSHRRVQRGLHRKLADANGLSRAEAGWLWRVALAVCPKQPAAIFVRPSLLASGAATRPGPLAEVNRKLFAS